MKISESQLRKIIRENLSDKPPGWVIPPPEWEWNSVTNTYSKLEKSYGWAQIMWDPYAQGPMDPMTKKYTKGCWILSTSNSDWSVSSPEEGFLQADMS